MEPLVDCESGENTAEGRSPPVPGSFALPGWCSIDEELESGEATETDSCVEADHSLHVSVVINSGPLSTHTSNSLERGRRPGTVGED
jgi:hypothetical protein